MRRFLISLALVSGNAMSACPALQEPGSNKEISSFCVNEYAIDFPMFARS